MRKFTKLTFWYLFNSNVCFLFSKIFVGGIPADATKGKYVFFASMNRKYYLAVILFLAAQLPQIVFVHLSFGKLA